MKRVGTGSTGAAIALGLFAGVAVFVIYRALSLEPLEDLSVSEVQAGESRGTVRRSQAHDATADGTTSSTGEARDQSPHREALRHPSDTFRNTSLTSIIRQAGFVCSEIVSATRGADDMMVWRVSCEDAMVYLVAEDETGALHIEPMPLVEAPVRGPVQTIPEERD